MNVIGAHRIKFTQNEKLSDEMNSMVYINYNKKLKNINLKKKSLKDDKYPLLCEDMPSNNE